MASSYDIMGTCRSVGNSATFPDGMTSRSIVLTRAAHAHTLAKGDALQPVFRAEGVSDYEQH